jgi:hypothetical protein
MKSKRPEQNRLDEQSINEAATAALRDLQVDAEAKSVSADKDRWCIQFTAEYAQFCDGFRDRFGKENSFELIREKIKRHILKQQQHKIRSNVRVRRGKPQPQRQPSSDNLLETAVKTIEAVATQTAGVAGEIINQASSLPETVLSTLDNATRAIGQISAPANQPAHEAEQPPLARITVKAASARKAAKKRSGSASKGSSKKAGPAKKAASKKKPVASKSTSKSAAKSGRKVSPSSKKSTTKKSASKKSTK